MKARIKLTVGCVVILTWILSGMLSICMAQEEVVATTAPGEAQEELVPMTPPNDLPGWVVIPGAAYRFNMRNSHQLTVITKAPLLTSKNETWLNNEEKSKFSTELAKHIRGKLMKMDEVQSVDLGYRLIVVNKFLLDTWDDALPKVLKVLEALATDKE